MIYLAGPIDKVSPEDAGSWRKYAASKLQDLVFNPYAAFGHVHNPGKSNLTTIKYLNDVAISLSNAMLVNGTMGGNATWDEVDLAIDKGIPVYVYSTGDLQGYSKSANIWVFDSLGDAIEACNSDYANGGVDTTEDPECPDDLVLKFMLDVDAFCGTNEPFLPDLPTLSYDGDVGYDLPSAEKVMIPARSTVKVRMAFQIETPPGYWWRLIGRSSARIKLGLDVREGVMDEGYRGPVWAVVTNLTNKGVVISQGQRIAQCIPQKSIKMSPVMVDQLSDTERGDKGFGSSGE